MDVTRRRPDPIKRKLIAIGCGVLFIMATMTKSSDSAADETVEARVRHLVTQMTLAEKVGQMSQVNSPGADATDDFHADIRTGRIGSVINEVDVDRVNEFQRIAVEESRLGIPLLIGRDVIHGFNTVMPIPLGQAASWNPNIVRAGARIAAKEAASVGVNWTFAPMIDISRDPRWGRIAESFGEDPYLTGELGAAMIEGFQGSDLGAPDTIAACAKHFAGYGASESGRDYNTTNIPEIELRNVYLPPFKAAVHAGVATFMASFGDLNGVPATGNEFLMRQVLREEWEYEGFVVSDWDSIRQLAVHGFTATDRDSAYEAIIAGIDMEMAGDAYISHLEQLVRDGVIDEALIDRSVSSILRTKFQLGLFDRPYTDPSEFEGTGTAAARQVAKEAAQESIVLLKNDNAALPLNRSDVESIAVIGPMADAPYEQLGTWIFDGVPEWSITVLDGIRQAVVDNVTVTHIPAMDTTRTQTDEGFDAAVAAARQSDVAVLVLGEESILSGEAHSRADIDLPGNQAELVRRVRDARVPVVAVILAGRPLTLTNIVENVDAILYAWHPGTMGGAAIADVLFGDVSPSGKLPVTMPRMVGQVPIYYAHKNTGKPATPESIVLIDDIAERAPQTSFGMTSFHLDAGFEPLYPFGFGLSYANFEYSDLSLSAEEIEMGHELTISARVSNTGDMAADEVVQLYVRDLVGSVTRPVRELKGFSKIHLEPGESQMVSFELSADDLEFFGRNMKEVVEAGEFQVWIGGSSKADLGAGFRLLAGD
jgi:beta-glucosidase